MGKAGMRRTAPLNQDFDAAILAATAPVAQTRFGSVGK